MISTNSRDARYVRLVQKNQGYLNVSEIEVISNGVNIAQGATVTNGKTSETFPQLIDNDFKKFTEMTATESPTILIDLGSVKTIHRIRVTNIGGASSGRIAGSRLQLLNEPNGTPIWTSDEFVNHSGTYAEDVDTGFGTYECVLPSTKVVIPIYGQFVRLSNPKVSILNIAEIEIYSNGVNIAKNKPVTMSSVHEPTSGLYGGMFAVDVVHTNFAHTSGKEPPFISVDLGTTVPIDRIRIVNRPGATGRICGSKLEVITAASTVSWTSNVITGQSGQNVYEDSNNGFNVLECVLPSRRVYGMNPLIGRYVTLSNSTTGTLNASEIEVFSEGVNIARGKSVTMSSTLNASNSGDKAVDGDPNTAAHTSGNEAPWIRIDLGSMVPIDRISVSVRPGFTGWANGCTLQILNEGTTIFTSQQFQSVTGSRVPHNQDTGYLKYECLLPKTEILSYRPTSGRFVKLSQSTGGIINIAELQVLQDQVNIAKGKIVTMSSGWAGNVYPGSLVVDENITNFAHTSGGESLPSWIMVDLGWSQPIDSIRVVNRRDAHTTGRILGAKLEIIDNLTTIWSSDAFKSKRGSAVPVDENIGFVTCECKLPSSTPTYVYPVVTGRYVTMYNTVKGILNIAEFQVHSGNESPSKGKLAIFSSHYMENNAIAFPVTGITDVDENTISHTSGNEPPWITIDLGAEYPVDRIYIINRKTSTGRIIGAKLEVKDSGHNIVFTSNPLPGRNGGTTYQPDQSVEAGYGWYEIYPPDRRPIFG